MDISTTIRASAIIYADEPNANVKATSIKRKFIEAIFVTNDNTELSISELANSLHERFELSFTEEELYAIIRKETDKYFFLLDNKGIENKRVSLTKERYLYLSNKEGSYDITFYIDTYLKNNSHIQAYDSNSIKELLNKYVYELLNTNIASYSQLLNPKKDQNKSFKIKSKNFTPIEIDIINEFLNWDNSEKNKAIFKLLSYALEYALVSNNAKDNVYLSSLRTKQFYLDTNILYRALGINGKTRKKRTIVFLKKCNKSGQKLYISVYTKKEFEDSIDFHINQLKASQFGRINPAIFESYCYGESIYQYYHEWRKNRITYGFDIFKAHLIGEYKNLLKSFNITEDYKSPFDTDKYDKTIERYKEEIKKNKFNKGDHQHLCDARNLLWLELLRKENNTSLTDTKYYFISTDQKLKLWDDSHSVAQPLILLPSQWMALILKYYSRTDDDFKSFVSFLNLPKNDSVLTETELQVVLSGISEITEDFSMQDSIIEDMVASRFNGIIDKQDYSRTREQAKQFAKEKFEEDFIKKLAVKDSEIKTIETASRQEKEQLKELLENSFNAQLEEFNRERIEDKKTVADAELTKIQKRKTKADKKIAKRISLIKTLVIMGVLIYVLVVLKLVDVFSWEEVQPYFWVITFLCSVFIFIYNGFSNKEWKPKDILQGILTRVQDKFYDEYDVDLSEIEELEQSIFRLGQQTAQKTEV